MLSLFKSKTFKDVLIFSGLLALALLFVNFAPNLAFASAISNEALRKGGAIGGSCEGDLRSLVKTILQFFLGFLGFVAVIMVIYGGVLYVTSAGNEENATKGKTVIMYAVIGIIIIAISYALVTTILGAAAPSDVTTLLPTA